MDAFQAPKAIVKLVDEFLNDEWGPVQSEEEQDRLVYLRRAQIPGYAEGELDLSTSWVERLGDVEFVQHSALKNVWLVKFPDDSGQLVVVRGECHWSENQEFPDGESCEFAANGRQFETVVHDEGGVWKLTSPKGSQFSEGERVYALAFWDGFYLTTNGRTTFTEEWTATPVDDPQEAPEPQKSGVFLRDLEDDDGDDLA